MKSELFVDLGPVSKASDPDAIDSLIDPVTGAPFVLYQASQTLADSQSRHRRLLSRISALIFELTADGTVLYVNEAVTRTTGYRYAELVGHSWWDTFSRGERGKDRMALTRRFRAGDVTNYDLPLTAKDGSTIILDLTTANRYGKDQAVERIIGFGIDITHRRAAETQLRESEARYRQIAEMAHEGIWMLNAKGLMTDGKQKKEDSHRQPLLDSPDAALLSDAGKRLSRNHERVWVRLQCLVVCAASSAINGTILNISPGGCQVRIPASLSVQTEITLQIYLPGGTDPFITQQGIVRSTALGQCGVEFINRKHDTISKLRRLLATEFMA